MLGLLGHAPSLRVVSVPTGSRRIGVRRPTPGGVADGPDAGRAGTPTRVQFRETLELPWAEASTRIPSVVVTTHAWPAEWPRPLSATARATARPITIVPARFTDPVAAESAGIASPVTASDLLRGEQDATATHHFTLIDEPRRDRRSLISRVAVLAVGLVLSLIAVEAATRAVRR